MDKDTLIEKIKGLITSIVWPIFLWSVTHTEDSYWKSVYEQEKALKERK